MLREGVLEGVTRMKLWGFWNRKEDHFKWIWVNVGRRIMLRDGGDHAEWIWVERGSYCGDLCGG